MPENEDPFGGAEHFEALGDIWAGFAGASDVFPTGKIYPKIVNDGIVAWSHDDGKLKVYVFQLPGKADVAMGVACVDNDQKALEIYTAFPVLAGKVNELNLTGAYTWENGIEGEIAVSMDYTGGFSFYAPFYLRDFMPFRPGKAKVEIAALAFDLQKAEKQQFVIGKGPLYDIGLADFLKDNPGKNAVDYEGAHVDASKVHMLLASPYVAEFQTQFPVQKVEECSFEQFQYYRLTATLAGMGDNTLDTYVYVEKSILKGYVPQAGDAMRGLVWLQGQLKN